MLKMGQLHRVDYFHLHDCMNELQLKEFEDLDVTM